MLASTKQSRTSPETPAQPEWLRVPAVTHIFGISRSRLYEWIAEGRVRSVSIRERNQLRGTRLIDANSIRAVLDSMAEGGIELQDTAEK